MGFPFMAVTAMLKLFNINYVLRKIKPQRFG